ncbi:MAG: DUF4349 domain-containing protein [Treponemataceae bacterium]|nr:DUF4349 domain-containing protein [Treponemataceae bacterium]
MKTVRRRVFIAMVTGVFLFSCAKNSAGAVRTEKALAAARPMVAPSPEAEGLLLDAQEGLPQRIDDSTSGGPVAGETVPKERKLIYRAQVELRVSDIQKAFSEVTDLLKSFGAYLAHQTTTEESITAEIRVPREQFQNMLTRLEQLGKVRTKNIFTEDVTDTYFDLEQRIKNKRTLVERYREYLKSAKNIEEILKVEQALSDATYELERLEGSFTQLSQQIAYSTINLVLEPLMPTGSEKSTFLEKLQEFFASYGETLGNIVIVIIGLVVYGIPLLLIGAFVWYLSFGKIGFVRKLFRLIHSEKKSPTPEGNIRT